MGKVRTKSLVTTVRLLGLLVLALAVATIPGSATSGDDVKVTAPPYTRHDGGSDTAIDRCSSAAAKTGGHRQRNEPSVAINPTNTQEIVAGANDYCTVATFADTWMGFYVSHDGGATWTHSLNPGYPTDTSALGQASPIFGIDTSAGDPVMSWDDGNRLFYGGIAFNRTATNASGRITPANGNAIVSTWVHDASAPLGMRYLRTVITGAGTPAPFFTGGRFNDKPSLRVDTGPDSPFRGNVYFSWTLFPGIRGQDQILFSRSTDHGQTFSTPMKIAMAVANVQGTSIAIAPDGTVYVAWRQFAERQAGLGDAIIFSKSTDGGQTFTRPATIAPVTVPYDSSDVYDDGTSAGDCGDTSLGVVLHCLSNYTFHRTGTLPQAATDQTGTVYVTWEQVTPASLDGTTYRPQGQSQVVFSKSINGGASWDPPSFVDLQPLGHQWWPNLAFDKSNNRLALVYYDSREDPFYDAHRPPGNRANGTSSCSPPFPPPTACDVLNTFVAISTNGGSSWTPSKVSAVGHQPEYEMFGGRRVPFHGDYIGIDAAGGTIFIVWTDNRNVSSGPDPRDLAMDGFDVEQCRSSATAPDTCPNAGGLDQNIYGKSLP
jgi:hypothetical protein